MDAAVIKFILEDGGSSSSGGATDATRTDVNIGDTPPARAASGSVEAASRRGSRAPDVQVPERAEESKEAALGEAVARQVARAFESLPVFGAVAAAVRSIAEPLLKYSAAAEKIARASGDQEAAARSLADAAAGSVAAAGGEQVLAEAARFDPEIQGPPVPPARLPAVQGPEEPGAGPWRGSRPGETQGPPLPPVSINAPVEAEPDVEPTAPQGPPKPPVRLPAVQGPPSESPWKLPAGKVYAPPEVQGPPVPVEISSPAPAVQGPPLPVAETTQVAEGAVAEEAAAASGGVSAASAGLMALAGVAAVAGAVAVAMRAVVGTVRQFDSAMMSLVGQFGEFSGELAAAVAQQRVLDTLNRVENARFMGDTLARFVEQRGEIGRNLEDLKVGVLDGLAKAGSGWMDVLEGISAKVGGTQLATSMIVEFLAKNFPLVKMGNDLADLLKATDTIAENTKPVEVGFFDLLNGQAGGVAPPPLAHNGRVYVDGAGVINGGSLAPGGMAAGVGGPIPGLEFP